MHVRALVEELDLGVVAAPVVVVADVHRHVEVFDQVNEKPESDAAFLDGSTRVLEDGPKLSDLRDDVALGRLGAGEAVVVSVLVERDIDVVPGTAPLDVPSVLVGPVRSVGQRLARFEQCRDGRSRPRIQVPLRNPSCEPVPTRSPGPTR